ncbi:hypothetical protein PILCRDRAFT_811444 [Piloderma croceum F 1598]|uniref:Vacuolar sorting protein n=1 Tax=Piloderma croceum (strain F 1598) TaxID=765440 RepID=A0A0C3BWM3_PILCF|nr:hypothetical protein PILCRDRAFT_811444 [Piloderma croceum F 1598]
MISGSKESALVSDETTARNDRDTLFCDRGRAKEFVELHDRVQTSVNLLDSLESFLSTFQKDLSAVSGQISELQDRSKDIDNRLRGRRRIEKPLSSLLSDVTIPPALATLILDTDVSEPWISAIGDFEQRLDTLRVRSRVKAARDLGEVAEGLRIVTATKLRAFFLALLEPIRTSVTTNMQVLQTSIILKYKPLFVFLQRQAANVAQEVQSAYMGVARTYYETGFRRYSRSLGWIKARATEKVENIVSGAGENDKDFVFDLDRLAYGKIDGPGVTLAFQADDKAHKEPIEALFRSLFLVLMDNVTAEYSFVTSFFSREAPTLSLSSKEYNDLMLSPTATVKGGFDERSTIKSEIGGHMPRARSDSIAKSVYTPQGANVKMERAPLDAIWKQIMDPVLEYCQTFVKSALDPIPPVVALLTMIRLTEDVIAEVQKRGCPPMESYIFGIRLQMWPVFQKAITEHVEALKKLAEGTGSSYFSRSVATTDAFVSSICNRYIVLFNSFVALTDQEDETMIFSNLLRLRLELTKLIAKHTERISDSVAKATTQSTLFEGLLQGLSKGTHPIHPKSQREIAYWAEKEEEARRRIVSANQRRK